MGARLCGGASGTFREGGGGLFLGGQQLQGMRRATPAQLSISSSRDG